mmetsp:Transcript_63639/g.183063  ORF Transcript_63639/g.183063 Transcript_63639/m.183063 type:complete len:172 (+) Transcript_63639:62-577(+)
MKTGLLFTAALSAASAFSPVQRVSTHPHSSQSCLSMAEGSEAKEGRLVSGEELEMMLTEWDQPLVVDAYATWCGPCQLMAPEFEAAAQELKGKVRFAKIDTDKDEAMAARLNIMGLPTLLFLDKFVPKDEGPEEEKNAKAVLKGRIEGALRKENIVDLCNFYFFDGPEPTL